MLKQDTTLMPDFTRDDAQISELLTLMHEVSDLGALAALAEWDQNTEMPEGAGAIRGDQMATLQGIMHERWTSPRLGQLLDDVESTRVQANLTDADKGLIREARRQYDQATKLPRTLVEEIARTQAGAFEAWRKARTNND